MKISSHSVSDALLRSEIKNDQIKRSGLKDYKTKSEVEKVSKDFESLFVNLVLKSMRKTVSKSELIDNSHAQEIYEGMLDEQYSKMMVANKGSFGLAKQIEEQLLRIMNQNRASKEYAQGGKTSSVE